MMLQRPGGSLYHEIHGSGEEGVVVYLNGFASGISTWYPVIKSMNSRYRNILYDYLGTGNSDCDVDYPFDFAAYCDDLNALIDHCDAGAVNLVGYSMGGWIAQTFASRFPDRVQSLTLVNSSSRIFAQQRWIISHFIEVLRDCELSVFSKLMFISYYSPEYFERHQSHLDRIKELANRYFERQRSGNWTALLNSCLDFDAEPWLGELAMPVLAVSGEHDFLCPRLMATRFAELIPNLRSVEYPAVGHAIPMERYRDLGDTIRTFVMSVTVNNAVFSLPAGDSERDCGC